MNPRAPGKGIGRTGHPFRPDSLKQRAVIYQGFFAGSDVDFDGLLVDGSSVIAYRGQRDIVASRFEEDSLDLQIGGQ